jgi:hypothetical protein
MKAYRIIDKKVNVGELIQNKHDESYVGICTRISKPQTWHGKKDDIRFPYIDGQMAGSTIDNWQVVEKL